MMFNDVGSVIARSDIVFGDIHMPSDSALAITIASAFSDLTPHKKFAIAKKYEKILMYIADIRSELGDDTTELQQEIKNLRYAVKPHKNRLKGNAGQTVQRKEALEPWC